MTVWKAKDRRTYRYRFFIDGRPYRGNTKQITKADAEEWETERKREIRRQLGGLTVAPEHSPRFTAWAEAYLKYVTQKGRVRRPEQVASHLRVVLRFWGAKPSGRNPQNPPIPGEPYHDLRLADPIRDPDWIEKFETWMAQRQVGHGVHDQRQLGPASRNQYRSVLSRLYRVAMLPRFRKQTGVTMNPFLGLEQDRTANRQALVTPAELRRWLQHTAKHAQLAIAIAALAPKLRLRNVLDLHWDRSFDPQLHYITVPEHKTLGTTGQPMIVAISATLRTLLLAARTDQRGWLIQYQGRHVGSIRWAVRAGAKAAGLLYGREAGGVTFHSIRHMAATLLAEVPHLTEAQRAATMGQDIETTQRYTHLRPASQKPVLDRLAGKLRLETVLAAAFGPAPEPEVPRTTRTKTAAQTLGRMKRSATRAKPRSAQ